MRFDRLLPALYSLFTAVSAQTLSGLTFDGRDEVSLIWAFDGQTTGTYDFYLCAGDESTGAYESLTRVITDGTFAPGDYVSFRVDQDVGGNDPNAYFLKVVPSNSKEHWSGFTSHFTLTHMKGTFSTTVSNAVKSIQFITLPIIPGIDANLLDASNLPPTLNSSILNSDINDDTSNSLLQFPTPTIPTEMDRHELRKRYVDQHTVPYGEQTGLTKYAPMPKRAGTTIATRSPTPQYPPFPFSIATTYLGAPTVQYTDTAYLTWTTHSIENTAAPAAAPTLDKRMQQWLERWKD
ncbi:cell wall synthesis protein kre9 precursor [Penicillium ochrochloron]